MYTLRSLAVFIVTLLALILTFSSAHADFYVIAGGGKKVGKEIKQLPYTITEPGFYYITKNLPCAAGSHGITIQSSEVTIDLMGFSLVGPGGTGAYHGIYAGDPVENMEIRNGNIKDFQGIGCYIYSIESKGCRIVNIKTSHNGDSGIYLRGDSNIVKDCISFSNGYFGIYVGHAATVTGNSCHGNVDHGIRVGYEAVVQGNSCYENEKYGIYTGHGCSIVQNSCRSNTSGGILAGTGSSVIGNACYSNTTYGINLGSNCYVGQNTCYQNGTNMDTCSNCTFDVNHAPASGSSAVHSEETLNPDEPK